MKNYGKGGESIPSDIGSAGGRGLLAKIAAKANTAEAGFLTILRYAGLVISALAFVSAAILLAIGAFQQIGKTQVAPEAVSLVPEDIIPPKAVVTQSSPAEAQQKSGISQEVRNRTASIYQRKFKSYQRADSKITDQELVDYVWSSDRIDKFDKLANQQLVGKDGKALSDRNAVMFDALALIESASTTADFGRQLNAYRNARKVNVCNDEVKSRSHIATSWDSSATSCPGWYDDPVGCSATREVQESYVEKVCAMKFPDELESPAQQFGNAMQRYAEIAEARLIMAQTSADEKTANNRARKLDGFSRISTAGTLFIIFLGVMFLYLFVALERHHRSLRRLIEKSDG